MVQKSSRMLRASPHRLRWSVREVSTAATLVVSEALVECAGAWLPGAYTLACAWISNGLFGRQAHNSERADNDRMSAGQCTESHRQRRAAEGTLERMQTSGFDGQIRRRLVTQQKNPMLVSLEELQGAETAEAKGIL